MISPGAREEEGGGEREGRRRASDRRLTGVADLPEVRRASPVLVLGLDVRVRLARQEALALLKRNVLRVVVVYADAGDEVEGRAAVAELLLSRVVLQASRCADGGDVGWDLGVADLEGETGLR